jgi:hypothetical protein
MGLFQSILDTPVNSQFIAPPPVQMYQPHGAPQPQQGTGGSATDAILGKIGFGGSPGAAGGGAAAGGDAAGAAGAGGSAGIMDAIMKLLPMIMGG